jgi:amino acid adenylation domain-containing protein
VNQCIHHLFTEQVALTPDAVALVFEDCQLTYRELEDRSNQLAHYLQEVGVAADTLVGICVERSVEMLVGILGILKAGGAYVPLDPTYPQERRDFILADTKLSIVLTQQHLLAKLPDDSVRIVILDAEDRDINRQSLTDIKQRKSTDLLPSPISHLPSLPEVNSQNLAYVMYTSGSTGQPKGVSIIHRGVVRLVNQTNYVDLTNKQVFLQLAPISFDASTFEIWGCLLNGGKLVIAPPRALSIDEIGKLIQQHQVNILWLTAGLFHSIVDTKIEILHHLKQLLAGGDILSVPHVQKFLNTVTNCQLINGYGPTENTTFTCCYPINLPLASGSSIPIGKPISNTQVYILDEQLHPVAAGTAGELYIGGDGLARGYFDRPELTTEKFILNPLLGGAGVGSGSDSRLYKTGDLARYLPDGNIEFLGRIDNQVKIRGFRIELGEIEQTLAQHPDVRENVVLAHQPETGDKQLVAYIVPQSNINYSIDKLRSFLQQQLPDYLIPSAFIRLESLPLTPNGKVDRHKLPAPSRERPQLDRAYIGAQNDLERILVEIWSDLLKVDRVGIDDNFFDLGGTSLSILQVAAAIEQKLGMANLPIVKLFQHPTISSMAKYLATEQNPRSANDGLKNRAQLQKAAQARRKR